MQTFLPYESFKESAQSLDMKRLGKQRVETLQLLNAMTGKTVSKGWKNHPCKHMWSGNMAALVQYGLVICKEWLSRGYKDTCYDKIAAFGVEEAPQMPWWLGAKDFHISHQSNLIRKKEDFYKTKWPTIDNTLPYLWPVNETKEFKTI